MSLNGGIDIGNADLERGSAGPDLPNDVGHTDQDLLARAREVNTSGKFIFTCYSELNTFLLLRAQDEILRLQRNLQECVEKKMPWTDEDANKLQEKLKQYRIIRLISQFINNFRRIVGYAEDDFDLGTSTIQS